MKATPPALIALHKWPAEAAAFHDNCQRGLGLSEQHPAYHLRNFCMSKQDDNGFGARRKTFSFTADCLERVIKNEPMPTSKPTGTGLQWLREAMPQPYQALRKILRIV